MRKTVKKRRTGCYERGRAGGHAQKWTTTGPVEGSSSPSGLSRLGTYVPSLLVGATSAQDPYQTGHFGLRVSPRDRRTCSRISCATLSADELISQHLPLVAHVVRETMGRVPGHVNRDDLTSAGMMALVQAQRGYDATAGVPFASYATTRIRGAVLDELRSVDWASRSVRRRARDLDETRNQLATALGRIPTHAEVASALGPVGRRGRPQRGRHRPRPGPLHPGSSEDVDLERPAAHRPARRPSRSSRTASASPTWWRPSPSCRTGCAPSSSSTSWPSGRWPRSRPSSASRESRVSQIRAEALILLRGALDRALEPDSVVETGKTTGCVARRRESYYSAVAARHASGVERAPRTAALNATA